MSDRIELGSIVGIFGWKGELRVMLHNRDDSSLANPRPVVLIGPEGERACRMVVRPGAGKRILGRVDGVDTEEGARALIGYAIEIARADLPPAGVDEYYVADLVGLEVETPDGTTVGRLAEVVAGKKDVWVVETDAGEVFFTATPETVLRVDVAGGRIVVSADALLGE